MSPEHQPPRNVNEQTPLPRLLLPPEVAGQLPKIGATQDLGLAALAQVRYFEPDTFRVWYGAESDGTDLFWGLVVDREVKPTTFTLDDLRRRRGTARMPVERDVNFAPASLAELKARHEAELAQLEQIAFEQALRQREQESMDNWLEAACEELSGSEG